MLVSMNEAQSSLAQGDALLLCDDEVYATLGRAVTDPRPPGLDRRVDVLDIQVEALARIVVAKRDFKSRLVRADPQAAA